MQKRTHLIFAFLLFLLLNRFLNYPPYLSVFALIGAMIPDIDLCFKHRTWAHSVWFLILLVCIGFIFALANFEVAMMFSIGFLSHLISDSLTHRGVKPLWPIGPKLNGPVCTGGISEWVAAMLILFSIFVLLGILRI